MFSHSYKDLQNIYHKRDKLLPSEDGLKMYKYFIYFFINRELRFFFKENIFKIVFFHQICM